MIFVWVSSFFVHFLAVVALWSRWTQHQNFHFIFLRFDTVLSVLTPENFANIWQIKWNKKLVRWSLKWCEFTFYVTFSVCCHPEILLPWQCDAMTSPLYYLPNRKIDLSRITGWDSFGAMHVHLLGVTNYTHKINNTKFGTWKHFIQSQNLGILVCGDLNFYLQ